MALPHRLRGALAVLALVIAAGCSQVGDRTGDDAATTSRPSGSTTPADATPADASPAPTTTPPTKPPTRPATGPATRPETTAAPPSTTAAPTAPVDLGGASRYVVLGDSFSAGDGLAPYEDVACGRSLRAYPHLVRFTGATSIEILACHAAQVPAAEAQAAAAGLDSTVGLVTLTIGGNDVGFIDFFSACATRAACFDAPYGGEATLRDWSASRRDVLRPHLVALLSGLRTAAPNARVALLGYPQLLPTSLSGAPGCQLLGAVLDAGELAGLRVSTDALNTVLAEAAEASGVLFVPVADRFAGHEACGPGEPWLLFGSMAEVLSSPEGVLHPNDAGQAAYASALAAALGG